DIQRGYPHAHHTCHSSNSLICPTSPQYIDPATHCVGFSCHVNACFTQDCGRSQGSGKSRASCIEDPEVIEEITNHLVAEGP
ncbi:MAG: hypothetical protein WBM67_15620, partial [Sedimenticolaceae bacterium]